jgi:RimJ/RimL family protein N-acetyltransferase
MILATTNPEIILRSYNLKDVDALTSIADNRNIWLNLRDSFPYPYSTEDATKFITMCIENVPETLFAIDYQGVLAGSIGLHMQQDIYRHSAELGYFVGEPFWNKAIASVSVQRMIQYGFEILHLHRIFASVYAHNKASMSVLEKNGFLLEGIKKQAVFKNDNYIDEYFYGKLNG